MTGCAGNPKPDGFEEESQEGESGLSLAVWSLKKVGSWHVMVLFKFHTNLQEKNIILAVP